MAPTVSARLSRLVSRSQTLFSRRGVIGRTWPQTKSNDQHIHKCENRVDPVNSPRPFFKQGAYTESDNAPARK